MIRWMKQIWLLLQDPCKMANLREYYERALREFGSTDSGK